MPKSAKKKAVGDKNEVWKGQAKHTSGGLTKNKLMKNPKSGKVVSIAQYKRGKALYARMKKEGKLAAPFKKGHKVKRRTTKKRRKSTRKRKGRRKSTGRKRAKPCPKPLFALF